MAAVVYYEAFLSPLGRALVRHVGPTEGRMAVQCSARWWDPEQARRSVGTEDDGVSKAPARKRSEEHTSELQSRFDLVCRLLLEKKKIISNHQPPPARN